MRPPSQFAEGPRRQPAGTMKSNRGETTKNKPAQLSISLNDIVRQEHRRWLDFLQFIEERKHTRWVYRGSGSRTYECKPSAGRVREFEPLYEVRVFRAFQHSAGLFLGTMPVNDWEWLERKSNTR